LEGGGIGHLFAEVEGEVGSGEVDEHEGVQDGETRFGGVKVVGRGGRWAESEVGVLGYEGDQWGGEDAGIAATLHCPGWVKVAAEQIEDIRVEAEAGVLETQELVGEGDRSGAL